MRVDVLTTTIHPELVDHCKWMVARQKGADVRHLINLSKRSSVRTPRDDKCAAQHRLLEESDADCFLFADDDDYIPPNFIRDRLNDLGDNDQGYSGVIPTRHYLLNHGAYATGKARKRCFLTFVLFRGDTIKQRILSALRGERRLHHVGSHSSEIIVMRGVMADPRTSMTMKNTYSRRYYPNRDKTRTILREWLQNDPEAFDRYMRLT